MGDAKRRGDFETRKQQAIAVGRIKVPKELVHSNDTFNIFRGSSVSHGAAMFAAAMLIATRRKSDRRKIGDAA